MTDQKREIRSCLVCSISQDHLEEYGVKFTEHIENQHNADHYLWLYLYLLQSKSDNSLEAYLKNKQINKQLVSTFPTYKSLRIQQIQKEEEDQMQLLIKAEFEKLRSRIDDYFKEQEEKTADTPQELEENDLKTTFGNRDTKNLLSEKPEEIYD